MLMSAECAEYQKEASRPLFDIEIILNYRLEFLFRKVQTFAYWNH